MKEHPRRTERKRHTHWRRRLLLAAQRIAERPVWLGRKRRSRWCWWGHEDRHVTEAFANLQTLAGFFFLSERRKPLGALSKEETKPDLHF